MNIDETLQERGRQYGKFVDVAKATVLIQEAVCDAMSPNKLQTLPAVHAIAIDMICHKLARICTGNIYYADNWHDIAGYAQLVADHLNGIDR